MNGKLARKIRAQVAGYHPGNKRQYAGNVAEKAKKYVEKLVGCELPNLFTLPTASPYPSVTVRLAGLEARKNYQIFKRSVLQIKRAES